MAGSQKLKIELSQDPRIPLLVIYLKELKSASQRDMSTPMFIAALFIIAKMCEQPKCPLTGESIKKTWYIHTMECNPAFERKEILTHTAAWINVKTLC